ncbi:hypothetical protein ACFLYB_03500 [Chloroflexota bacterium]
MDVILDTNYLAEYLKQYFNPDLANRGDGIFQANDLISPDLARSLNSIMILSGDGISNLVIASTFAFIELARNWESLAEGMFTVDQLHAFVYEPPPWFSIAPVDYDLLPYFIDVPTVVVVNSKLEAVEWTDAVHMATVISRGLLPTDATMATSDVRLKGILRVHKRLIF